MCVCVFVSQIHSGLRHCLLFPKCNLLFHTQETFIIFKETLSYDNQLISMSRNISQFGKMIAWGGYMLKFNCYLMIYGREFEPLVTYVGNL